ncbi:hyalin-like isoform X2 [Apostichopus japonicus]|uniref:hyalin-like isoform X2 n=1 Tax=Stichopus japonicus TaxID=307972 RepID=UPI003AB2FF9B
MLLQAAITAFSLLSLPLMANAVACFQNNCENGSTCQDNLQWYLCICPDGFKGRHCNETVTGPRETQPPTITNCPTNIVDTITSMFTMVEWTEPSVTDENNVHKILQTHFSDNSFFSIGVTKVDYIFADDFANIANCSFTITLSSSSADSNPPNVIFCPDNINQVAPIGSSSVEVFWNEPIVTDETGPVTVERQNVLSGHSFVVNTHTTVMYEFSDIDGNLATCSFTVIVTEAEESDTIPPTILNCTSDVILDADPVTGEAVAIWDIPFAVDNNGPVFLISEPPFTSGSISIPAGSNISVEYQFSDLDRNMAVCQFNIIVRNQEESDTIPPTILNCTSDVILDADPVTGEAVAIWDIPFAVDNNGPVFLISEPPFTSGSLSIPAGSNISVEYQFSDLDRNMAVCQFNVIVRNQAVVDTIAPTISHCPSDVVLDPNPVTGEVVANWEVPIAEDNNSPTFLISQPPSPGTTFFAGSTTVIEYIFTDSDQNTVSCSFSVIVNDLIAVVDTIAPTISHCPSDVVLDPNPVTGEAVANWEVPIAEDNNSPVFLITQPPSPGTTFFAGSTTVIEYIFTDSDQNTVSCSFSVIVNDLIDIVPPMVNQCPTDLSVIVNTTQQSATVDWTEPYSTMNDSVSIARSHAPGSLFPYGLTTVVYTFKDEAGNLALCTFTVSVELALAITCPNDIQQTVDAPENTHAVVTWEDPVVPAGDFHVAGTHVSGTSFPIGITNVSYAVIDSEDNQAGCSFTIEILTFEAIICPNDIQQTVDAPETTHVVVTWEDPVVPDGDFRVSGTHASGTAFPIGITNVSYVVSDSEGNIAGCFFTIEILTFEAPSITCPVDIEVTVSSTEEGADIHWDAPTVTEPGQYLIGSRSPGFLGIGSYNVTYYLYGVTGPLAECSFSVNVIQREPDLVPPGFIGCPVETITASLGPGETSTEVFWTEPTASEHYAQVAVSADFNPGHRFPPGQTTVSYIVRDEFGNTGVCNFLVEVFPFVDTMPPTITNCPDNMTKYVLSGSPDPTVEWNVPSASDDDSDVNFVNATNHPGDTFPRGVTMVTYTYEDQSGNQATCVFTVMVIEIFEPILFRCPFVINVDVEVGLEGSEVTWEEPFVTTSLNDQELSRTAIPGTYFPLGISTVTYTFNFPELPQFSLNCSFIVNVKAVDDMPPLVIYCPGNIQKLINNPNANPVIKWNDPIVEDDSGKFSVSEQSHSSGTEFPIGTTDVSYKFMDESRNVAECKFQVSVQNISAAVLLPMTFDVQGDYDDDLRITTSNAYITFVQSLGEALDVVINSRRQLRTSFGGLSIVQLTPGSIVADVEMWFHTVPPVNDISLLMRNIIDDMVQDNFGHLGNLNINSFQIGTPVLSPIRTTLAFTTTPSYTSQAVSKSTDGNSQRSKLPPAEPPQSASSGFPLRLIDLAIITLIAASVLIGFISLLMCACRPKENSKRKKVDRPPVESDNPLDMVEEETISLSAQSSSSHSTPSSSFSSDAGIKKDRFISINKDYDIVTADEDGVEAEEAAGPSGNIAVNQAHVV